MIDLIHKITNDFNDKSVKFIDAIFIDKSNAFDSISHEKLLEKLNKIGIRETFLSLIESYLSGRKQLVKFEGIESKSADITSGCPQGVSLSPVFFIIY